ILPSGDLVSAMIAPYRFADELVRLLEPDLLRELDPERPLEALREVRDFAVDVLFFAVVLLPAVDLVDARDDFAELVRLFAARVDGCERAERARDCFGSSSSCSCSWSVSSAACSSPVPSASSVSSASSEAASSSSASASSAPGGCSANVFSCRLAATAVGRPSSAASAACAAAVAGGPRIWGTISPARGESCSLVTAILARFCGWNILFLPVRHRARVMAFLALLVRP